MMYFDESFADRAVHRGEVEAADFATYSMNFNARGPVDMAALVSSDKDLRRAALGLAFKFRINRLQRHQRKNRAEEPTTPRQGQGVQRRRATAVNQRGAFCHCQREGPPIALPRGGLQRIEILIIDAKSNSGPIVDG
ncbi:MAG: hypothetical protein NVS1B11_32330 [Terriglobales bacterium]